MAKVDPNYLESPYKVVTEATRPSAGIQDRFVYESDTGRVLHDDGAKWNLVSYSSTANVNPFFFGWVDVSVPEINNGPSGWSVSKTATGIYVITHELGLSSVQNLIFMSGGVSSGTNTLSYHFGSGSTTSDTAEIRIYNADTNTDEDQDFIFSFLNTEYTP